MSRYGVSHSLANIMPTENENTKKVLLKPLICANAKENANNLYRLMDDLFGAIGRCSTYLLKLKLIGKKWKHINELTSGDTVNAGAKCRARYSLCQHKQSNIKSLSCTKLLIDFGLSSPSLLGSRLVEI